MRFWITITLICTLSLACEPVFDEFTPKRLLQIDAVLYSNDSLPLIKVRSSFAGGTSDQTVNKDAVYISEASISLFCNGKSIQVQEVEPGLYDPLSTRLIEDGDVFEIGVAHRDDSVYAKAQIPSFDLADITISPVDTLLYFLEMNYTPGGELNQSISAWTSTATLATRVENIPVNLFVKSYPVTSDSLSSYFPQIRANLPNRFERIRSEDFINLESARILSTVQIILPDTGSTPSELRHTFLTEIIVPEPIVGDYLDIVSDQYAPVTITNVEGGVGLFIGAAKYTRTTNLTYQAVYIQ